MLRLGFPVIGVTDMRRAVAFWTAALEPDVIVLADPDDNPFCVVDLSRC